MKRATNRGAQRACARLAAGALVVFFADPQAAVYKRVTGALVVFAADPPAAIYKRMFPLKPNFQIYFQLKWPVDEERESVTS
ncbi:hypothetical protein DVK07_17000 [Halorubrum sp. Atlit-26R]|nr:hypothetical protein DVK07_17000 [Halorubrum sp. Atlit-26R]